MLIKYNLKVLKIVEMTWDWHAPAVLRATLETLKGKENTGDTMVFTHNPATQEAEAEGPQVQGPDNLQKLCFKIKYKEARVCPSGRTFAYLGKVQVQSSVLLETNA